jgi:hypothetical protein
VEIWAAVDIRRKSVDVPQPLFFGCRIRTATYLWPRRCRTRPPKTFKSQLTRRLVCGTRVWLACSQIANPNFCNIRDRSNQDPFAPFSPSFLMAKARSQGCTFATMQPHGQEKAPDSELTLFGGSKYVENWAIPWGHAALPAAQIEQRLRQLASSLTADMQRLG